MTATGVGFAALAVRSASRFSARPWEAADNFAMAAYLAVVTAGFNTIGFLATTLVTRVWRRRPPLQALVAGGVMGGVAFLLQLSGIAFALPLTWVGEGLASTASLVLWMVPGIAAGLLVTLLARLVPRPAA